MLQPDLFDGPLLVRRLSQLGLRNVSGIEFHENTTVLVSVTPKGVLRIHRGFAYAPDAVLSAIVRFVRPGLRRDIRRELEKGILGFPVHAFVPAPAKRRRRRRRRTRPEDRGLRRDLVALHETLNDRHFQGRLGKIPFRVSRRMHRRLGEVLLDHATERPVEIAISHRHISQDGWEEVRDTLLHEMIHQWQAETGRPVDHGLAFREKAKEIGIVPRATRDVGVWRNCQD